MSYLFFSISDSTIFCLRRKNVWLIFLLICLSFIGQSTFSWLLASTLGFLKSVCNLLPEYQVCPPCISVLQFCSSLFLKCCIYWTYRTLKNLDSKTKFLYANTRLCTHLLLLFVFVSIYRTTHTSEKTLIILEAESFRLCLKEITFIISLQGSLECMKSGFE